MSAVCFRVYCEENVVVDFFLADYTGKRMDVFIYHPTNVVSNCFDETQAQIGIVILVPNNEIIFEVLPTDDERHKYYSIGLECIKKSQDYPHLFF